MTPAPTKSKSTGLLSPMPILFIAFVLFIASALSSIPSQAQTNISKHPADPDPSSTPNQSTSSDGTGSPNPTDFSKRIFTGGFDTTGAVFPGSCLFYIGAVAGHASSKAGFESVASFTKDTFQRSVDCRRIYFPDDIIFNKTNFAADADFTRDTFTSVADFSEARFQGDCHFLMASFQNYADFSRTHFGGTGYFSDIGLTDTTLFDFYQAALPDTLDFSANPNIPMEINLSVASFSVAPIEKRHLIFLAGSEIAKFRMDYKNFKLLFTDPKTGKEISDDEKEAVYECLLKNFQDRGQLDSYKLLDIEFQGYQWKKKGPPLSWFYIFPHYWNFYGHENGLVFFWTFVFLLIFTLINYRFLDTLDTSVYPIKNIAGFPTDQQIKAASTKKQKVRLSWERFWKAFVYTSIIFFLFSLDISRFRFDHKKAAFFLLVVYTTGIICIAYMANFVITK